MKTKPEQYDWKNIPFDGTLTTRQIADMLGCAMNTVRRHCRAVGGKVKPVPHSQRGQKTKAKKLHPEMRMLLGHNPTIEPEKRPLEGLSRYYIPR